MIERVLAGIDGGRVLDVATQEGGFVQILMDNLKAYTEIVGIDTSEQAIETARSTIGQAGVRFLVMDAEQVGFEDESFDTVTISASLHHLSNIRQVLKEMSRVLKPGGHFFLAEMHRDGQTEAELTTVYLHQWVAEVDSALGRLHNRTLARQEFVDSIAGLGLSSVDLYDLADTDSDPMDEARIEHLEGLIDRTIQQADGTNRYRELRQRGEALRRRLHEVGSRREPVLIVVAEK
jgi:2-polyprenyl-3-methyl-5-hydroxy-6-metoxy-1,4-benzoquinol methylase